MVYVWLPALTESRTPKGSRTAVDAELAMMSGSPELGR
jgi:hypothetical protein